MNQELLACSNCTWHMKELYGQQLMKGVCLKDFDLGESLLFLAGEQEDLPACQD